MMTALSAARLTHESEPSEVHGTLYWDLHVHQQHCLQVSLRDAAVMTVFLLLPCFLEG